jgi:methyl-accepting chemotaxis protein
VSPEALLIVFVGISAVALVCQSLSMWQTSRSITQMVQRLEHQSREIEGSAQEVLRRVQGVVDQMAPLGEIAENLKDHMDLISAMVTERAQDLDQFVQEITEMSREQASKVNYVVGDTVQKIEQTTEMIQEDVLKPAIEISSFLKGLTAGLTYLFNKKKPVPPTESRPEEEELFI